eukprot:15219404-Alexandrium_andersonii.AAC.1
MPASSASPELNAMVFRVAEQCFSARRPRARTPPLVGRRAARHLAKSASTYVLAASRRPAKGSGAPLSGAGGGSGRAGGARPSTDAWARASSGSTPWPRTPSPGDPD